MNLPFLSVHSKSVFGILFNAFALLPLWLPKRFLGSSMANAAVGSELAKTPAGAEESAWSRKDLAELLPEVVDCADLLLLDELETLRPSLALIRFAFWTLSVGDFCGCLTMYFRLFCSICRKFDSSDPATPFLSVLVGVDKRLLKFASSFLLVVREEERWCC